jgi:cobalt-zinc-cadmium efflux system membrane fusion protein
MAVTALINTDSQEVDALPDEAVVTSGGKSYIFVLQGSNKNESEKENYNFVRTEVVEGIKALGYTQIIPIEPLPESAIIAVANAFYLNSMASDHGEED